MVMVVGQEPLNQWLESAESQVVRAQVVPESHHLNQHPET